MGKLYLITGSDEYTVKNKSREIVVSLCGGDPESNPCLEIIHADNDELKLPAAVTELLNTVDTPPFLGASKTVWLKNLDFAKFAKYKDSEKFEELNDKFMELLKKGLPSDVTLVMSVLSIDRRSSFFKSCQKTAEIHFFEKVDINSREWNETLRGIIYDSCRKNNKKISEEATAFIAETIGTDTGRVQSELDKLFAFVHPRDSISLADCKNICSRTPETAGWAFSNSLSERNLPDAIEILNALVNSGTKNPEMGIIYMVMRHFQEMCKIKAAGMKLSLRPNCAYPQFTAAMNNVPPDQNMKMEGNPIFTMNPYRAWKIFSQSQNFKDEEFADILTAILAVNKVLVSGGGNPTIALESLAVKICSKK